MKMIGKTLLTTAIFISLAATLVADPVLQIRDERFEMGTVPQNVTLSHHYWFRSVGTDTVVIDDIKISCGCTMIPLENNKIPPGDSLKVDFCWDIKRTAGPTGSYPYIFYNGDAGGVSRVYMTSTVSKFPDSLHPITAIPYILDLTSFRDKNRDSVEFKLRNYSNEDLTVTPLSMDVFQCDIVVPESVPGNGTARGYIKVKPEYLDKDFKRSFTLLFSDKQGSRITIPVRRKIY